MKLKSILENEYLITNGIGGFVSASITGANTRRYHSLLNASLNPPVNRTILLSKLDTVIYISDKEYSLESTIHKDNIKDNSQYLKKYTNIPVPKFNYKVEDVIINKTISMKYGENTTGIKYDVTTYDKAVNIKVYLHVNHRNHHELDTTDKSFDILSNKNKLHFKNKNGDFFITGFGKYNEVNTSSKIEILPIEKRRGLDFEYNNYISGYYEISIPSNSTISFGIVASTNQNEYTAKEIISSEIKRKNDLTSHESNKILKQLNIACDQFIVHRQSTDSKTIIAGYPWFTDWGRDTMISLPGLTLSTKRYSDAKNIISTFLKYLEDGLIPNMFPDTNVKPMYNTIDGTLWLFIAIYKYFLETDDKDYIISIFNDLENIISSHIKGTKYNIKVDNDGLLSGGDPTTQLTWMDVKIDGHVVTPRHGKAVEINALWYNALNIVNTLADNLNLNKTIDYKKYINMSYKSFNKYFWNKEQECLYDLIQDGKAIDRIRPNQIFAVSLPFSILSKEREKLVVKIVEDKLLTPFGLRSLSQDHEDYEKKYDGDVYKRDYAYHQGTVWGWLIGPYLESHYKIYNNKNYIISKLDVLIKNLNNTGLGTISEVFSGDKPFVSRGCISQAWSVSEVLRIYKLIE